MQYVDGLGVSMALFPLWRILILIYFDLFILLCCFVLAIHTVEGSEGLFLLGVPSMTATRALEGNGLYLIL